MQPLVSPVDHESRNNSYRREDEGTEAATSRTPLLTHPYETSQQRITTLTRLTVACMALLLVVGVAIGAYLLFEQDKWMPK